MIEKLRELQQKVSRKALARVTRSREAMQFYQLDADAARDEEPQLWPRFKRVFRDTVGYMGSGPRLGVWTFASLISLSSEKDYEDAKRVGRERGQKRFDDRPRTRRGQ